MATSGGVSGPRPAPGAAERRSLGVLLREARRNSTLTQIQVANHLNWAPSKLIRIDGGIVSCSPVDTRSLLSLYGVSNMAIEYAQELARACRFPYSWAAFRDVYSSDGLAFFVAEESAECIYKYEPMLIPSLLQTSDYAAELLGALERLRMKSVDLSLPD